MLEETRPKGNALHHQEQQDMGATVRLFFDWRGHKAGEVVHIAANTAADLVAEGLAKYDSEWQLN